MLQLLNKIYSFNISAKVHVLLSPISVVNDFCLIIVSYYKIYVLRYRKTCCKFTHINMKKQIKIEL